MTTAQPAEGVPAWHLRSRIRTAEVAGQTWAYIDTGSDGPVLAMLPGSVGTCEMFFKQIAALGERMRLIAISYPAEPDPAKLADGLAHLLDHLGIERASVVGASFGGYWAQFVGLRHADRVETLFLGNIFLTPDELRANPLFDPAWVHATLAPALQETWYDRVAKAPDSELKRIQLDMLSGRQTADNLKARFVGVVDATLCPPLPLPASRTVVIDCADDPIIPPVSRQAVRDRYPAATHRTLPAGGHYPHILNTKAYDAVITERLLGRQN